MKVLALKRFSFSSDGMTISEAAPGDEIEIPDGLFPGLHGDGFVRPRGAHGTPQPAVEAAPQPSPAPPVANPVQTAGAPLRVRHVGRGQYAVFKGETRLTHEALDKHVAEAAMADLAGKA